MKPKSTPSSSLILSLVAFLYFAFVVVFYYYAHKPFSLQTALSLGRAFWAVMVTSGLVLAAGGLGKKLLSDLELHPLASLCVCAALGLGGLGLCVLVAGALGLFKLWAGALALLALFFSLRRDILGWLRGWTALRSVYEGSGRVGRWIGLSVAMLFVFTLASALSPAIHFDALCYHLTLPHHYLMAGRFIYVPQIMYWGMPQMAEMLYTWMILLAGDQGALLLGWFFGLLAMAGLLGYLTQRLEARSAWIGLATMLSGSTTASLLSWGYVDWLVILFGVALLISLDTFLRTRRAKYLILAGVFTGFALGTKYTAGVLLISGTVTILWFNRKQPGECLRLFFQYVGVTLVVFLPWLVKNLWATGNPFYPFLFPAGAMDRLRLDLYQGGVPWGDWRDVFLLPFRATFWGVEAAPGYNASIGPIFLGLGLLAWLGWSSMSVEQRTVVALSACIALPGILVWMVAGRFSTYLLQTRLYFAFFPALAVLAAVGFLNLERRALPGIRFGWVASILICFVLGLNVIDIAVNCLKQGAPQVVLGLTSEQEYLANNLGWYAPAMQAIRQLPPAARVLMLWEARSRHCLPQCVPDEIVDRWLRERHGTSDGAPRTAEEIRQSWLDAGFTHLLYHRSGADFYRTQADTVYQAEDWQVLDALLDQLSVVETFGNAYVLYRLER